MIGTLLAWVTFAGAQDIAVLHHGDIADGRPDHIAEGFVAAYELGAGLTLRIGDTLTLGAPSGASASTTAIANRVGARATTVAASWYTTVYNGTQAATMGKAIATSMAGAPDPAMFMAPASLAGAEVRIDRMKLAGTKKRPVVWAECAFVDTKDRRNASGIVTVSDLDRALRLGEVTSSQLVTREVAVQRLKEAKDLLDLGVYTPEQFEAEKAKYLPFLAPSP